MQTQTLNKSALLEYILQGRLECFRSSSIFSPLQGAAFHSSGDGSFYYSSGIDCAFCNGIITDQKEISDKEIESGIEFFHTRKLPFIWWSSQNLELKEFQAGGALTGIAIDITHGFSNISPQIAVRLITKNEELNTFSRILIEGFGMCRNIVGQYQAVLGASMHHNEQLHYLAFYENIPVGTVTLTASDSSGIWNISVLPQYQNKGIRTALISTALAEAHKLGYDHVMAILMPKDEAYNTFARMGFQKICEFPYYIKPYQNA